LTPTTTRLTPTTNICHLSGVDPGDPATPATPAMPSGVFPISCAGPLRRIPQIQGCSGFACRRD
jgi:hypothetical protein